MPITKRPQTFEASDGAEFATEAEAKRHQALLDASRDFRSAEKIYHQAIAKTQKTADGRPFEFGVFRDYYLIHWWGDRPRLVTIDFIGRDSILEDGKLYLVPGPDKRQAVPRVAVEELYVDRLAARKELLRRLEEWIADVNREIEELMAEVSG